MPTGVKKTHEDFIQEIYCLVGNEYEIKSKYINGKAKILFKHNKCGNEFWMRPNNFLKGQRCKPCSLALRSIKQTKTHKDFVKEVYELVGNEYEVLGKYINANSKILMRHNKCSHEWYTLPYSFLNNGRRCPKCQHRSYKKTTNEFKQEVYDLVGDEYEVLGKYITNLHKITMKHNKCGHIWDIAPIYFLNGRRCPICTMKEISEKFKKKHDTFLQEVYELVGNEYSVFSEYLGAHNEILMKHNICNNFYLVKPNSFLKGNRCPFCRESKGEKRVNKFLKKYKINFKRQYIFNNCRNKNPLPFDFAIFDNKNNLICLIEYDGEHHFRPVCFGGMSKIDAENHYKDTIHNDQLKDNYCKQNNISLLRIPYWEFDNIENILIDYLSNFKEIIN